MGGKSGIASSLLSPSVRTCKRDRLLLLLERRDDEGENPSREGDRTGRKRTPTAQYYSRAHHPIQIPAMYNGSFSLCREAWIEIFWLDMKGWTEITCVVRAFVHMLKSDRSNRKEGRLHTRRHIIRPSHPSAMMFWFVCHHHCHAHATQ